MDIQQTLRSFDLNKTEIAVYLFLLKNGPAYPTDVSRETKVARTNCYNVLKKLHEADLVTEALVGRRKKYQAKDPSSLRQIVEKKKDILKNLLPELSALYFFNRNKPVVEFFSGLENIKQLFDKTIGAENLVIYGDVDHLFILDSSFFNGYLKKLGIHNKGAKIYSTKKLENVSQETSAAVISEKEEYQKKQLLFFADYIAFINFENPAMGVLIRQPALSNFIKTAIFNGENK